MKPIKQPGKMNETEEAFSRYLDELFARKEIFGWRYEPCKFILSPGIKGGRNEVTYKPDFLIVWPGHFEYVDTKSRNGKWSSMRSTCRAKINIASELYPWFKWTVAYLEKGVWGFEDVNHGGGFNSD